ncbi:secondary thiamine-phosphate synthase enzyme YjbQ [Thermococcus waiotapuensis]|uniref:Secondary thiamine-phosphate synthase enzyme YjbQ n=1 Tax=Thermococcus waiotapuensis TaxID=90909 RepID=A0AAE4NUQ5_9EURY|nr:secondary thiamine-phosphate synthase enzyme YjbQ [Thermococcus waiotapuensis]MDV3102976.1 secondary thiamine-phosphate synthase enzyme YjbQ [Thermococcus waiotapuensis]
MRVFTKELRFSTRGEIDLVNITGEVERAVEESRIENGQVLVFVPGATGAVVTIEHEPGLLEDFKMALKELVPAGKGYLHGGIYDNAHSHLRATILGASECFPVVDGRLVRGTWQQVFFVELDVRPRHRRVVVQVIGE